MKRRIINLAEEAFSGAGRQIETAIMSNIKLAIELSHENNS